VAPGFNRGTVGPKPIKPVMTVMLYKTGADIMARGISEDATVFTHFHFKSLNETMRYLVNTHYPKYRVILNIPPEVGRMHL